MLNKTKKIILIVFAIIFCVVLILGTLLLTDVIDIYAKYRYPTAKEAVEAEGYNVEKVYGEVEVNGLIFYDFNSSTTDNDYSSVILIKNKNGYCSVDPFLKEDSFTDMYNVGVVDFIMVFEKFSKHIVNIIIFSYNGKLEIVDSLGNCASITELERGSFMAYFALNRITKDYKICVNGIWYPMPKLYIDIHLELPPQD